MPIVYRIRYIDPDTDEILYLTGIAYEDVVEEEDDESP